MYVDCSPCDTYHIGGYELDILLETIFDMVNDGIIVKYQEEMILKLYNYKITFDNRFICTEEDEYKKYPKTYRRKNGYQVIIKDRKQG